MARAKRHYLPGHVWHITHRCHKKEFLLKFARDRLRWLQWLFEAKKRYGVCILNYMVTSNHIHLLVVDGGGRDVIPQSIHLIAGRTGQEYNMRKNRNGAFWEWNFGGYNEIQEPRQRYALIDYQRLMDLLHISTVDDLRDSHKKWVEEIIKRKNFIRDKKWSQSIAVGSKGFVEGIKEKFGIRAKGRKVVESEGAYHLRETQAAYMSNFTPENSVLRAKNTYVWEVNP